MGGLGRASFDFSVFREHLFSVPPQGRVHRTTGPMVMVSTTRGVELAKFSARAAAARPRLCALMLFKEPRRVGASPLFHPAARRRFLPTDLSRTFFASGPAPRVQFSDSISLLGTQTHTCRKKTLYSIVSIVYLGSQEELRFQRIIHISDI